VVTHRELSPGSQAVQSGHALIEFIYEHPELANNWYQISKYLVFLSVKTKQELTELANKLSYKEILFSKFNEPDLDDEMTAIALEPTKEARKVVSSIPLMLSEIRKEELS
jgi:peptidyl-tRNA hydrolase